MSVHDAEQLLRLVTDMSSKTAAGDLARDAVAALGLVRRIEDGLCMRRDDAICALHRSGESLQQIRERTGLSRARVHQIIRSQG